MGSSALIRVGTCLHRRVTNGRGISTSWQNSFGRLPSPRLRCRSGSLAFCIQQLASCVCQRKPFLPVPGVVPSCHLCCITKQKKMNLESVQQRRLYAVSCALLQRDERGAVVGFGGRACWVLLGVEGVWLWCRREAWLILDRVDWMLGCWFWTLPGFA